MTCLTCHNRPYREVPKRFPGVYILVPMVCEDCGGSGQVCGENEAGAGIAEGGRADG